MRVGLIAPPWIQVPPPAYGGTESVIANLALGLRARGHEVTLFTVGTSTSPVRQLHLFDDVVGPIGQTMPETAHVLAAYESLAGMDVIHDHTTLGPLMAGRFGMRTPPVITTNHGPFTDVTRAIFAEIARTASVVAISKDQASRAGHVPIAAVIHHGIDLDAYQCGSGSGGYLAFVGRMSPEKGVARAVQIAHAAGRPLRIISKMREPAEIDYFTRHVLPLLSRSDPVPEELGLAERIDVLREAEAMLNPIDWNEPFGLVMAESLAAGTPVVVPPRGAAPEIVTDRRTGFLYHSELAAVAAVGAVGGLSRATCRAEAESRFSIDRMAADHERLYRAVLNVSRLPIRSSIAVRAASSLGAVR